MYSNSNSFLGGSNSLRPGPQQYGASFGPGPAQSQQPQQPPFGPQTTGYAQTPLQQQYTGLPGAQPPPQASGQVNPQYTGYSGQPLQHAFRTGAPPVPSIPQQFMQQPPAPPPPPPPQQQQSQPFPQSQPQQLASVPMKPQPTGFSEMAASFQTSAGSKTKERRTEKTANKIPNIRLSFITAQDQAKFETLFKSAVGDGQTTMSGEKARDLLLRSRLDGEHLSHIWTLADTTRAGQLHFPEFALAMYLCNLKLNGKSLPSTLPENVKNEVSSMVDIINFSVADEGTHAGTGTGKVSHAPGFAIRENASTPPAIHHPQPQPSNSQLLQAQMTGFPSGILPGFSGQSQGLPAHQATLMGVGAPQDPQATGYMGHHPPMPPMPTGYGGGGSMLTPLNSQPTGRPGQWGLVNTPSTGLPNIDALQARMMPQQGREQQDYTTVGLQGNAVIPWAITKDEKTRYDALFRAWDGMNKGYISGTQAIEIFGQSGLEKPDLERAWTLADTGNKGRLDLDEFAVAMHLIYRKLNGYPLPNTLPPELVPPSARNFNASIGAIKGMLHQESDYRKNSGAALLPQKTGVSYLKSHSFRNAGGPSGDGVRKDATVFKNNDDAVGYRSSARRRIGNGSPRPDSPSSVTSNDDLTLDQLRKKIKEKQVLLDAVDFADEKHAEEDDVFDRRDHRESEELYRRIRRVQEDLDAHPDAPLSSGDSDAERRALKRQLQHLTDRIPDLASQVRKIEKFIADARGELFRLRDAKAHPGSAAAIVGTGPGGTILESDRLKARAKAMMQQRTAALTGKKVDAGNDERDATKRLEEESIRIRTDRENNERMVREVEESVRDFSSGIEDSLRDGGSTAGNEHEQRRWEDALGVEDEVRDFIFDLQRSSRATRIRAQGSGGGGRSSTAPGSSMSQSSPVASQHDGGSAPASRTTTPSIGAGGSGGSYSSYKTAEDRAAFIRQQAEQRMAERLAALGIKAPTKTGETANQRLERERSERASKLRQAEVEDARREEERQIRLAEEQGAPNLGASSVQVSARVDSKPPPPPPSRKSAVDHSSAKRTEEEHLDREGEAQQSQTQDTEKLANSQEDDLQRENDAAEARLKALEEQVRQGRLRKEEEKRKKKAALVEAKEREAKLAARRAEIEAARRREEELQRQLQAMEGNSSSSDEDDGPAQITPQASTPTLGSSQVGSQELERKQTPPPMSVPVSASPTETKAESRNPYFRMLSQSSEASSISSPSATIVPAAPVSVSDPSPATITTSPAGAGPAVEVPTNPFHRNAVAAQPTASVSRKRLEEDDGWGSDKDDDEDNSSDDERPGGTSAAELASILFGTMAPPRPLSAAGEKSAASQSPIISPAFSPPPSAPAAPPPLPPSPAPIQSTDSPVAASAPDRAPASSAAPTAPPPPPPPPPVPGLAPPPPPPPPAPAPAAPSLASATPTGRPAAFLSQIQAGKSLKKTTTRDRSGAAVTGQVLD